MKKVIGVNDGTLLSHLGFGRSRLGTSPFVGQLRRWVKHRETDAYIISYPKSGRTWLRLMISYAICRHWSLGSEAERFELHKLSRLDQEIPTIRVTHDDDPHRKEPSELEVDKRRYRRQTVVLLVRDPRDILVSQYFQRSRREHNLVRTLPQFLRDPDGLETLLRFYEIWVSQLHVPRRFCVVRYEDLHRDAVAEMRRVCDCLDLSNITDEVLREGVSAHSFDNMRKMEQARRFVSERLSPGTLQDTESFKVRRGRVGGFRDYLEKADQRYLDDAINARPALRHFGYCYNSERGGAYLETE